MNARRNLYGDTIGVLALLTITDEDACKVLDEGEIGVRSLRSAKAIDTFILNGNDNQTWEPSFTYHGFRFIEVNGWPNSTALDAEHITVVVVHSDMERTGYSECSNSLLNRFR